MNQTISKEKLQEATDTFVANMIAEKIVFKLSETLQEQWNRIISELAYTRKINEKLRETLTIALARCDRLESVIENYQNQQKLNSENNRKATEILKASMKELGLSD